MSLLVSMMMAAAVVGGSYVQHVGQRRSLGALHMCVRVCVSGWQGTFLGQLVHKAGLQAV